MWWFIGILVVSMFVSYALTPKSAYTTADPATIDDIQAPTASQGRSIPVLFGTRLIKNENVVWYGDLKTKAVKKKGGKK